MKLEYYEFLPFYGKALRNLEYHFNAEKVYCISHSVCVAFSMVNKFYYTWHSRIH